jgi:hypothetical protein
VWLGRYLFFPQDLGNAVAGEFWRIVDGHDGWKVWLVSYVLLMHVEVDCTLIASSGVSFGRKLRRGSPGRYPLVIEARLNVTKGFSFSG